MQYLTLRRFFTTSARTEGGEATNENEIDNEIAEASKDLFDETLNTKPISLSMFKNLANFEHKYVNKQLYELIIRSWEIKITDMAIWCMLDDSKKIFLEIAIASSRREHKVNLDNKTLLLNTGNVYKKYCTSAISDISKQFEKEKILAEHYYTVWYGNFVQLQYYKIVFQAWSIEKNGLNKLDGICELPIIDVTTSNYQHQLHLKKITTGITTNAYGLNLALSIEQITNFTITLKDWYILNVSAAAEKYYLIFEGLKCLEKTRFRTTSNNAGIWSLCGKINYTGTLTNLINSCFLVRLYKGKLELSRRLVNLHRLLTVSIYKLTFENSNIVMMGEIILHPKPIYSKSISRYLHYPRVFDYTSLIVINSICADKILTRDYKSKADIFFSVSLIDQCVTSSINSVTVSPTVYETLYLTIRNELNFSSTVNIDMWCAGEYFTEHIGYINISLMDILYDNKSSMRELELITVTDHYTTNKVQLNGYRAILEKQLNQVIDKNYTIKVKLDMGFVPAKGFLDTLDQNYFSKSKQIQSELSSAHEQYVNKCKEIGIKNIIMPYNEDSRGVQREYFSYIKTMFPPITHTNQFALFQYVSTIQDNEKYLYNSIETLDICIISHSACNAGKVFLFCSLLYGINVQSCVLIGWNQEGEVLYSVAEYLPNGDIRLWNFNYAEIWLLKNRVFDLDKISTKTINYKLFTQWCGLKRTFVEVHAIDSEQKKITKELLDSQDFEKPVIIYGQNKNNFLKKYNVHLIANIDNVYLNLNPSSNATELYLDYWNNELWFEVYSKNTVELFKSENQITVPNYAFLPLDDVVQNYNVKLKESIVNAINVYRRQRKLKNIWYNNDLLSKFLLFNINLRYKLLNSGFLQTNFYVDEIGKLNKLLSTKIPPNWYCKVYYYKTAFIKTSDIVNIILEQCPNININARLVGLSVEVKHYFCPGNICQIYICVLACSLLSFSDLQRLKNEQYIQQLKNEYLANNNINEGNSDLKNVEKNTQRSTSSIAKFSKHTSRLSVDRTSSNTIASEAQSKKNVIEESDTDESTIKISETKNNQCFERNEKNKTLDRSYSKEGLDLNTFNENTSHTEESTTKSINNNRKSAIIEDITMPIVGAVGIEPNSSTSTNQTSSQSGTTTQKINSSDQDDFQMNSNTKVKNISLIIESEDEKASIFDTNTDSNMTMNIEQNTNSENDSDYDMMQDIDWSSIYQTMFDQNSDLYLEIYDKYIALGYTTEISNYLAAYYVSADLVKNFHKSDSL